MPPRIRDLVDETLKRRPESLRKAQQDFIDEWGVSKLFCGGHPDHAHSAHNGEGLTEKEWREEEDKRIAQEKKRMTQERMKAREDKKAEKRQLQERVKAKRREIEQQFPDGLDFSAWRDPRSRVRAEAQDRIDLDEQIQREVKDAEMAKRLQEQEGRQERLEGMRTRLRAGRDNNASSSTSNFATIAESSARSQPPTTAERGRRRQTGQAKEEKPESPYAPRRSGRITRPQ